jgi:uncharacterized protein (DUF934 family)
MAESGTTAVLWTLDGFRPDDWVRAGEREAGRPTILPLSVFLEIGEPERKAARDFLAVEIAPAEGIDDLLPHLEDLPLVALSFPSFTDGRAYSKAELLRGRHGFQGRLRAVGDILIDQIPLMIRTGFTEFSVASEAAIRRLEAGRTGGLPLHYQPAAVSAARPAGSYSWRRLPT